METALSSARPIKALKATIVFYTACDKEWPRMYSNMTVSTALTPHMSLMPVIMALGACSLNLVPLTTTLYMC